MQEIFNQLGNAATVLCALSCACVFGILVIAGLVLRFAGMSLIPMIGDLIVGRVDRTPERSTAPVLTRPASSAVLKTQAQSIDFDEALRRQGGVPTIQAQAATYPQPVQAPYPQQAAYPQQPQGYANTGPYTAQSTLPTLQPSLQSIPPSAPPSMPMAGTIQPLYDNRVQPLQPPMQAQIAPNQPFPPAAAPYAPMQGPATPSLGQPAPSYQPLGGYPQGTPSLSQNPDPNAFFPPPNPGIPRRASLSAPRDVSADPSIDAGFNTENYPGLRNRRGRGDGAAMVDDQDNNENRNTLDGLIGSVGNFLGL